jgi:hypothetical protein
MFSSVENKTLLWKRGDRLPIRCCCFPLSCSLVDDLTPY